MHCAVVCTLGLRRVPTCKRRGSLDGPAAACAACRSLSCCSCCCTCSKSCCLSCSTFRMWSGFANSTRSLCPIHLQPLYCSMYQLYLSTQEDASNQAQPGRNAAAACEIHGWSHNADRGNIACSVRRKGCHDHDFQHERILSEVHASRKEPAGIPAYV